MAKTEEKEKAPETTPSPTGGVQADSAIWSDAATAPGTPPEGRSQVSDRANPKHRLHRDEMARVLAEGGSILHNGEIHTALHTLPEGYTHGEAFTLDSPHHPKNKAAREAASRLRDVQEGRIAPGEVPDSAEVEAEKQAKRTERGG